MNQKSLTNFLQTAATKVLLAVLLATGLLGEHTHAQTVTTVINLGAAGNGTPFGSAAPVQQIALGSLPAGSFLRSISFNYRLDGGDPYIGDLAPLFADADGNNGVLMVLGAINDGGYPKAAAQTITWNAGGSFNVGATASGTVTATQGLPAIDLHNYAMFLQTGYNGTWSGTVTIEYDVPVFGVTLDSPANGQSYVSGASILATANVIDPGSFNNTVTFTVTPINPPGAPVQIVSSGVASPYTVDFGALANGTYEILATTVNTASPPQTATSATRTFSIIPPFAPPASPPVTDGMIVWLPADGVNTADTNQVRTNAGDTFMKQWNDFSGGLRHAANPTEGDQPRYIASGLNGKPVIRFGQDNADNGDRLYLGDLSAQFPTGASVFIVATIDGDGRYNLFGNRANNDERWVADTWNESKPGTFRTNRSDSSSFTFNDWPTTGSHLYILESDATEYEIFINGTSIGADSGNYNSGAGTSWTIGNRATSGQQLRGDIAEVILYNRVLNTAEANQVGTYLSQKYGLSTSYGPPSVLSYFPTDNTNLPPDANLTLTFNRSIVAGTGNITLKNLTDATQTVIPIGDGQISISGAELTIDPTADLLLGKTYALQIDATAITDQASVAYAGIADDTTWNFSVAGPAPTTTVVTSSGSPSIFGDSVTFTAKVDPVPTGGTVQFYNGIFVVGTPVAVDTGTGLATITTSSLDAGAKEITATFSGNPQFTLSESASIQQTIEKAPLTVKANNLLRFVNTANPSLTYEITGFKNGQTLASSGVTGTPDLSTAADAASPVGDYPITCAVGDLTADNYSFTTFIDGILTVSIPRKVWNVKFGNLNLGNFSGAAPENATPDSFWNSITTATPSNEALADATGDSSSATLSVSSTISLQLGDYATVTGLQLFSRWIKTADNSTPFTATIGGLSASSTYDIIIYSDWFWNNGDAFPVTQIAGTGLTGTAHLDHIWTDPHGHVPVLVQDTDNAENGSIRGNWIRITGITPDATGNLAFRMGGTNSALNGFQLIEMSSGGGSDFATWIANPSFNVGAADQGFNADADGDGIPNGVEAWFGTNPGVSNAGITPVSQIDTVFTFTHPQANPPLDDVDFSYQWSTNMIDWYASGTAVGTTTVDIDSEPNTPSAGLTEVQADTESSTVTPNKLFIRGVAIQN